METVDIEALKAERENILKQLQEWHEKKEFEIDGLVFTVGPLTHQIRLEVVSVYSINEQRWHLGDWSNLTDSSIQKVIRLLEENIYYKGVQISKIKNFWDEHEDIYFDFIKTATKVVCYPFYKKKLAIG